VGEVGQGSVTARRNTLLQLLEPVEDESQIPKVGALKASAANWQKSPVGPAATGGALLCR